MGYPLSVVEYFLRNCSENIKAAQSESGVQKLVLRGYRIGLCDSASERLRFIAEGSASSINSLRPVLEAKLATAHDAIRERLRKRKKAARRTEHFNPKKARLLEAQGEGFAQMEEEALTEDEGLVPSDGQAVAPLPSDSDVDDGKAQRPLENRTVAERPQSGPSLAQCSSVGEGVASNAPYIYEKVQLPVDGEAQRPKCGPSVARRPSIGDGVAPNTSYAYEKVQLPSDGEAQRPSESRAVPQRPQSGPYVARRPSVGDGAAPSASYAYGKVQLPSNREAQRPSENKAVAQRPQCGPSVSRPPSVGDGSAPSASCAHEKVQLPSDQDEAPRHLVEDTITRRPWEKGGAARQPSDGLGAPPWSIDGDGVARRPWEKKAEAPHPSAGPGLTRPWDANSVPRRPVAASAPQTPPARLAHPERPAPTVAPQLLRRAQQVPDVVGSRRGDGVAKGPAPSRAPGLAR